MPTSAAWTAGTECHKDTRSKDNNTGSFRKDSRNSSSMAARRHHIFRKTASSSASLLPGLSIVSPARLSRHRANSIPANNTGYE